MSVTGNLIMVTKNMFVSVLLLFLLYFVITLYGRFFETVLLTHFFVFENTRDPNNEILTSPGCFQPHHSGDVPFAAYTDDVSSHQELFVNCAGFLN